MGSALAGGSIIVFGAIDPGYSAANETISGLGTGQDPYAIGFNVSLILAGILLLPLAWEISFLVPAGWRRVLTVVLLAAAAVGISLIGGFPLDKAGTIHRIASDIAFLGGGLGIVWVGILWRTSERPGLQAWSFPSMAAGAATLAFVAAWYTNNYLGLGLGGGERLLVAPLVLWLFSASVYLAVRADRLAGQAEGLRGPLPEPFVG